MGSSCSCAAPPMPPAPPVQKSPIQRWRTVLTVVAAVQEKLPDPMDHALDASDSDSFSHSSRSDFSESSESLDIVTVDTADLSVRGWFAPDGHPLTRFKNKKDSRGREAGSNGKPFSTARIRDWNEKTEKHTWI